ncbi:hypothetical protein DICPUDRAFT_74737, partial [Dictyostelium purpureum]
MKIIFALILIIVLASVCSAINVAPKNNNKKPNGDLSCAGAFNSRDTFKSSFSFVGLNQQNPFASDSNSASFFLNGELVYDRSVQSMVINYNLNNQGGDIVTWIYGHNSTQYTYFQDNGKCIQQEYDSSQFPNPFYVTGGLTTVGAIKAESL